LHGSNLMKELRSESQLPINFRFWGGDKMAAIAGEPVKHIRDLAFMGFVEVVMNLRKILGNISLCKKDILEFKPDVLVLIDYPGFNLRIAEWAKEQGIQVCYYISPQVWAWKESRVKKIKRSVDQLFVILPFEKAFFAKHGIEAEYVGHPLLDAIEQYKVLVSEAVQHIVPNDQPIIALLPGSRKQEVAVKLPIMLEAVKSFSSYRIMIAAAPSLDESFYAPFLNEGVTLVHNATYELLSKAELAVVTSGTATLETALFGVPEVVCYKGSSISYHIAKRLIKIKFISLVNLILDREAVTELIQNECRPDRIREELTALLPGKSGREALKKDYAELSEMLGGGGASKKVAQSLLKTIR